jgi:hypothetical protein
MSVGASQTVRVDISRPVYRADTRSHQPMESGIGPIFRDPRQAMLYRVDVHVIHVRPVISFILDQMFPEATLPDAAFAMTTYRRQPFLCLGRAFENEVLMSRNRKAKSVSPLGIRIAQCRRSGNTTQP